MAGGKKAFCHRIADSGCWNLPLKLINVITQNRIISSMAEASSSAYQKPMLPAGRFLPQMLVAIICYRHQYQEFWYHSKSWKEKNESSLIVVFRCYLKNNIVTVFMMWCTRYNNIMYNWRTCINDISKYYFKLWCYPNRWFLVKRTFEPLLWFENPNSYMFIIYIGIEQSN